MLRDSTSVAPGPRSSTPVTEAADEARGRDPAVRPRDRRVAPRPRPGCSRPSCGASEWTVEALTHVRTRRDDVGRQQPAGASDVDGVEVHRFPVTGRAIGRLRCGAPISSCVEAGAVTDEEQDAWLVEAGPGRAGAHRRDRVDRRRRRGRSIRSSTTPRSRASRVVADRGVLHPAAHDEPMLRLPHVPRRCSRTPAGLAYWSDRRTAARRATGSRWRRSPRSSSGSGSTPATANRTRRAQRSASATVRICCASAASTTARARGSSPSVSRATRTGAVPTAATRVRGSGRARATRTPDIVVAERRSTNPRNGALLRGALALGVAERVRVVLDRADGSVDGRHAGTRERALPGHPRSRATLRRRYRRSGATPSSRSRSTAVASPALRAALGAGGPQVRRTSLPLARRDRPLQQLPRTGCEAVTHPVVSDESVVTADSSTRSAHEISRPFASRIEPERARGRTRVTEPAPGAVLLYNLLVLILDTGEGGRCSPGHQVDSPVSSPGEDAGGPSSPAAASSIAVAGPQTRSERVATAQASIRRSVLRV